MLTEEEIRTAPTVVEAQMNSRLLTYCSDDTGESLPLTLAGLHRPTLSVANFKVSGCGGWFFAKEFLSYFEKSSNVG